MISDCVKRGAGFDIRLPPHIMSACSARNIEASMAMVSALVIFSVTMMSLNSLLCVAKRGDAAQGGGNYFSISQASTATGTIGRINSSIASA